MFSIRKTQENRRKDPKENFMKNFKENFKKTRRK